ncbi:hypothetical protein TcasGA2_TC002076 [Tribolium castaneum]|uniref:PEHE domain-containing protein n=1 Tax=Tribolium castaneum TaxID=7070 RepID=D7EIT1_TRICA|nr:PREDICTED: KAT8 regulatory NSL complex subunit 1 [Tribolium castaneum]EFA12370.1 hypothetical protein TcasGA2_TC002076 [Tribolium castaneum]|eukprot:XP_966763.1 PREDICTED: KAT8 regulatory NSL complex subunit 1 [Tribolium castaneum]
MGLRTASARRPYAEVMAPALTETSGQKQSFTLPPKYLAPECSDCDIMSDQNMGIHHKTTTSLDLTSPQDVDDLMQVIKSIPEEDMAIENLLTDDDVMNMSIDDPKETLTELKTKQNRIERRLDFLRRKIRKLQARNMGQHVAGEVAGVYEYVHRSLKRLKDNTHLEEEKPQMKPMSSASTKTMLKKLEMAAVLQAKNAARQRHTPKYFGSGSCEPGNHRFPAPGVVNVPTWPMENKLELQKVTGLLQTELNLVQHEVDSEATESSSGGESCDEMQSYNNPHQQYLSIQKRALWKYASQRAAIASRWTWLQAQISDLEYRIRQHGDIQRQIRASKGEIQLGGVSPPPPTSPTAVNGYRGQLPGSSPLTSKSEDVVPTTPNGAHPEYECARTRPLVNFKKRKLLQLNGLHVISKKAARPASVRCGCVNTTAPCAVCTGRTDPTHPRDPTEALSKPERIALVDPGFHPVFSMPEDASYAVHCEAIMKNPEWQQRSTRMKSLKVLNKDRSDKSVLEHHHRSKKIDHRKKYNRLLKPSTMSALSAKIRNKIRGRKSGRHSTSSLTSFKKRPLLSGGDGADEEVESIGNNSATGAANSAVGSPSSSPLLHIQAISGYNRRNRANSYDIDNIVIPYSVAAATRVEKLQYKEILTPKWRIADIDLKCDTKNNGAVRNPSQDSDMEDLSEEAVLARHEKSEYEEKKKFLSYLKLPSGHGRSRAHKRTDSLAESSGANTPDPLSPHPAETAESPLTSPPATPLPEELPSISAMRRRTISQSRVVPTTVAREENNTPENVEVAPFDTRTFPLDDETYEKMLKSMPENHQFKTNYRAQDCDYLDEKVDSPGSESTESALGEEDPNDPEWVDMERVRDRHKR